MSSLADILRAFPPYNPEAVPVDTAKAVIHSCVRAVAEVEKVALRAALGRVLAEDLISPIDVPGYDNSAMDGYAMRSQDLSSGQEVVLTQIGAAYAGRPFSGEVGPGQCVRIMTGAVLPAGSDTVVVQEVAKVEGRQVRVPAGQRVGQNRRLAGEDLRKGSPAMLKGTLLKPADIGVIASLGVPEVTVTRRLRVAFFSTGDELRSFDRGGPLGPLAPGELYDSNRYSVNAMLQRLGCEVIDLGVVRDDPAALEAAFQKAAADADAVITTGGVAEGDADYTRKMMARLADAVFWKLAMRPGRPFAFGRFHSRNAYLFSLPGNPVAVMVTFYHLVRGALLALMGARHCELPLFSVKAACDMKKRPGRLEYQRGVLEQKDGEWTVRLTGSQGSGILSSMAEANCFVVLRPEQGSIKPGDPVDVMPMEGIV